MKIDHTNKNFVEALGLKNQDMDWIEELVKHSVSSTKNLSHAIKSLSHAIEHAIEGLREKEFGDTKSAPSSYEFKIAIAGIVIGMIMKSHREPTIEHVMAVEGKDLETFFKFLDEIIKQKDKRP